MTASRYRVETQDCAGVMHIRAWRLQRVAAIQSDQGVRHVAWSPYDPCQAAFICQGGSLHTLQVDESPDAAGRLHVQVQLAS